MMRAPSEACLAPYETEMARRGFDMAHAAGLWVWAMLCAERQFRTAELEAEHLDIYHAEARFGWHWAMPCNALRPEEP